MLGGADNPNGELLSYIIGADITAGLGISPFDVVHIDVAGIAGTDNNYGAVAQLQFTF